MTIKPSIPSTQMIGGEQGRILSAMKESLELITGARGKEIKILTPNATDAEVISKINEIITRLNASGN